MEQCTKNGFYSFEIWNRNRSELELLKLNIHGRASGFQQLVDLIRGWGTSVGPQVLGLFNFEGRIIFMAHFINKPKLRSRRGATKSALRTAGLPLFLQADKSLVAAPSLFSFCSLKIERLLVKVR